MFNGEAHAAGTNSLLAQLPVHERNAIHRGSVVHEFVAGDVLLRANAHSEHVFFPVSGVVSLVRTLRDGMSVELAMVGYEGMIGLDVFMEAKTQLDAAIAQCAGVAYRVPADEFRKQFRRGGELQRSLLRFTSAFVAQVAQNAVCGRFHSLEGRLARWLLMIHDRTSVAEVSFSPAGWMLELGEDTLEEVLDHLVASKAIRRRKRSVMILNREIAETSACECYETLRQEYERTLAS